MSLQSEVNNALKGLGVFSTGPRTLDAVASGQRLNCELTALDTLAATFDRFVLHTDSLRGKSLDQLKAVGQALSSRLSYLLEPISPIEVDREGCVVQLRSSPPQKQDDATTYYELLVRQGELSLCRYTKAIGNQRQVVPACVTREVFLRLVGDFSAAAGS